MAASAHATGDRQRSREIAPEKLRAGHYRLVITDLEMPRMHGYELLAELRAAPRMTPVPVLVCSSRTSDKHRERAERAAATAYLLKPFSPDGLGLLLAAGPRGTGGRPDDLSHCTIVLVCWRR